jgi:hypothetical protein
LARKNRRVLDSSKKVVRLFDGNLELSVLPQPLPQVAQDILGVLGAEGVAAQAAVIANVSKSTVSYWKNRFVKAGALAPRLSQDPKTLGRPRKTQCYSAGKPKYYDLTAYGSKLLTGSEGCLRLPVVLEDHAVKFRVLRWERAGSIDWERLGEPRNWVKLGFRVGGVRVVKTSRSVIVHPGLLKGFDVDALEVDAGRIVERVRYVLEVKFGMLLADDCEALHDPCWQVYRPECRQWVKAGTCEVVGVGALDHSPKPLKSCDPLHKEPHLEYRDKRLAAVAAAFPVASDPGKRLSVAAVEFPLVLAGLEQQVAGLHLKLGGIEAKIDVLAKTTVRLGDSLEKIVTCLGKLFDMEGKEAHSSVEDKRAIDYVS